jgi:carbonic anhydrase/acetyltransferase-like protein (isoleucine patch superfamily)
MAKANKYTILKSKEHTRTLEDGTVVNRIRSNREVKNHYSYIPKGSLGGWVSNPTILDQHDESWISTPAIVVGNSRVKEFSLVRSGLLLDCEIRDNAYISVSDNCKISGSNFRGNSRVYGTPTIVDSILSEQAEVTRCPTITSSTIKGDCSVGNAIVENAHLSGTVSVSSGAQVKGNPGWGLCLEGHLEIGEGALITKADDAFSIGPVGSENSVLTVYRTKDKNVLRFNRGCFNGVEKEFKQAIAKTHRRTKYALSYIKLIEFANLHFGIKPAKAKRTKVVKPPALPGTLV